MRRSLPLALLLCLAASAARSQAPSKSGSGRRPAVSLARKIESFLQSARRRPTATAVAAVRGGNPLKQAADLEKALASRAAALRGSLLSGAPAPGAEAALRGVHRALAVSYLVRSAEAGDDPDARARASSVLKGMSEGLKADGMPPLVLDVLAGPEEGLGSQALLDNGWDAYAASLGAGIRPRQTARTAQLPPEPKTAELEESLGSVLRACLEKDLPPAELSEGLFLAGLLHQSLSSSDLGPASEAEEPAEDLSSLPADEEEPSSSEPRPEVPFFPRSIYAKASPSVVFILCSGAGEAGEIGSGSVIDSRGRVLTNAHVVIRESTRAPWDSIQVYLKPRKMTGDPDQDLKSPIPAKVLAQSRALDLALLELESPPPGLAPLPLGRPSDVEIGDRVAAIGHPEQGGLWTLTTGIVSTLVADLGGVKGKKAFQTDASINRGNSGGPLLNAAGQFIGVNTSMSRTGADGVAITSVNFAVRSDVARRWLAKSGVPLAYAALPPAAAPQPAEAAAPQAPAPIPASAPKALEEGRSRDASYLDSFSQSKAGPGAAEALSAPAAAPALAAPAAPVRAAGRSRRPPGRPDARPRQELVTDGRPYSIDRLLKGRRK